MHDIENHPSAWLHGYAAALADVRRGGGIAGALAIAELHLEDLREAGVDDEDLDLIAGA